MRTNLPYVLAAIALGFGMGNGSAANVDVKQLTSGASGPATHALDPSLALGAGFSALRSPVSAMKEEASLKSLSSPVGSREALVRPEEGPFAAFAGAASKDVASQQAIVGAPEMPRSNGFAALKAAVGPGATALVGRSARQEASQGLLERPAGTQWSNGFQSLRQ